jgi:hypothetical protein
VEAFTREDLDRSVENHAPFVGRLL